MRDFLLRPICEAAPGDDGATLAGGPIAFKRIETIGIDRANRRLPLKTFSHEALAAFTAKRAPVLGVGMDYPRLMGILNVTPDSFSDGGAHADAEAAIARGLTMVEQGADFIDIGGESTRPGAEPVPPADEQARVLPVIEGLRAAGVTTPVSIDTRNAETASAAIRAGAGMINDVSALTHDPEMLAVAAETGAAVCLMHMQGDPRTMQDEPKYRNVLIDIFDFLEKRVAACVDAGIDRRKLVIDPGIGFGKTLDHNIQLMSGLSAFHGMGLPVLLGASRKGFLGKLGAGDAADERIAGSVAAAIIAAQQGVQILRVHDVLETRRALGVWTAATGYWDV